MNLVMLGDNYQYPYAPLGADVQSIPVTAYNDALDRNNLAAVIPSGFEMRPNPATGEPQLDPTGTRVLLYRKDAGAGNVLTSIFDFLGKTVAPAVQTAISPKAGYTTPKAAPNYLPYILIGGAALVAVMFMSGTRKRA